ADADHVGGNEALAKAGQTLFVAGGGVGVGADFLGGGASILAAEKVLTRMSAAKLPVSAQPSETFQQPRKYMYLNGEGIEVLHQPAAHTDGDSIVFFRRSDVVMPGDLFALTQLPLIDIERARPAPGAPPAAQPIAH